MKLKELKSILYSSRDRIQFAVIYDVENNRDVEDGCSIEYAIKHYSDLEVKRIQAFDDNLVITV